MSIYLRSMETAVTFIEDHLQDNINVADIAASVTYSLYHFCRVFNQTVHHPPYDYLMRRRLSEAAMALSESKERITDIAFAYQFGSPESFSRAFRRMFGLLPTKFRKQGIHDPRILMKPLTVGHLDQRNQPKFKRPMLVEKEAFTIVGLMTIEQEENNVSKRQQPFSPAPTHTIHHYPDAWQTQGKPILRGTLGETAQLPFVSQTIPAHNYASFVLPNEDEKRPFLTDYIYQTWLPQSGYTLATPLEIEHEHQLFVPIDAFILP